MHSSDERATAPRRGATHPATLALRALVDALPANPRLDADEPAASALPGPPASPGADHLDAEPAELYRALVLVVLRLVFLRMRPIDRVVT